MKKILAIMIASLVFFWAQPSAAQAADHAGVGALPQAPQHGIVGATADRLAALCCAPME